MTPLKVLKKVVKSFEKFNVRYCLVGGHAASLYRAQERLTRDVDFAILTDPISDSQSLAEKVIKDIGLRPVVGFIPSEVRNSVCLVTSAPAKGEFKGIVDILLPELPWIPKAVARAEHNKIDLGSVRIPVITPEDLIVAKCYALKNSPDRFQDLDDLKEIFQSVKDLDRDYLSTTLEAHNLSIPKLVRKFL